MQAAETADMAPGGGGSGGGGGGGGGAHPRPLQPFALERFFAKYEFTADHQLCNSDRWGHALHAPPMAARPRLLHTPSAWLPGCDHAPTTRPPLPRPALPCSEPLGMAELLALADGDARRRWDGLRLCYTETQGAPALREAVAAVHFSQVRPDQLVVAAPQELLFLTMQARGAAADSSPQQVCCDAPAEPPTGAR